MSQHSLSLKRRLESILDRLAPASELLAFTTTVLIGAWLVLKYGPPVARTHDEQSYVLAGDTFAHGRLANPQHPLWQSFETFHLLVRPSYASKYPPGQGLVLALGQVLTGHQYVGVWFSAGLASAAVVWAIRPFVTARLALLAAFVVSIMLGCSYWSYSYWGGAVAACGGALVVGATKKWMASTYTRYGAIAGVGSFILAITRPFEGTLLLLALSLIVASRFLRRRASESRPPFSVFLKTFVLPYALIGSVGALWLLHYNARVTGHALMLPYVLYERQYGPMPMFVWGTPRQNPAGPTQAFVDFMKYNQAQYDVTVGGNTFFSAALGRIGSYLAWVFFVPPFGIVVSAVIFDREHRQEILVAVGVLFGCVAVMLLSVWSMSHYAAPLTVIAVYLWVRAFGWIFSRERVGAIGGAILLSAFAVASFANISKEADYYAHAWQNERSEMISTLAKRDRSQLVVVRYAAPHDFLHEWVYNDADIDGAKVVWARSIDEITDARLRAYYKDREQWLLNVQDGKRGDLTPLSE